jgi:hypothetical protein
MVLPENSNTGRIELGCQLRKADNSNITGIITCLRLGKAFKADDEGFLTMEYWIKSYKTIH